VLLGEVLEAEESNDFDRLEGLLCGAVKYLHANRSKPDQIVYLTLMHVAKAKPSVFNSELVIEVSIYDENLQWNLRFIVMTIEFCVID
jgi:integrator complex subunit 1